MDLLSQNNIDEVIETSKCSSNHLSQTTSLATKDKVLYSNSAKDLEIVPCLTNFQEMSESPRNTQKPVVDFQLSKQLP